MSTCTHRDRQFHGGDVLEETCPQEAVVEIKVMDPDDPSSGRFCMDHARTFLNAPTEAEWMAVIMPPEPPKDAEDFWMTLTAQEQEWATEALGAILPPVQRSAVAIALEILNDIEGNEQVDHARQYLATALEGMPDDAGLLLTGEPLKLAVSVAQKIGLPDYSSAEMSMHLSGVTVDTPDAEIDAAVERGRLVYTRMGERLSEQAKETRRKAGW